MPRRLLAPVAAALVVSVGACKLDSFMFDATKVSGYTLSKAVIPDSLQKVVTFASGKETLYGVLARQPGAAARRTVLYAHGNNDNIPYFWERVEYLWRAGFDVFIYDYRGFGMSSGRSTGEDTFFADARAALAYVLALPGVAPASLVLYGYSLGGAAVIELAAHNVAPRAVIIEAAFLSGEALVQTGTILDVPGGYVLSGAFDNVGKLPGIRTPLMVLQGTDDPRVATSVAEALYASAGGPKSLVLVSGANHSTVPTTMGVATYIARVKGFVENPPSR
jgi:alpha-beta hydrolase superfamily lysophospholipase